MRAIMSPGFAAELRAAPPAPYLYRCYERAGRATMTSEDQHPETRDLTVSAADAGARLDRVLANNVAELSRSRLKALVLAGQVTVGGRPVLDPGHHVRAGDIIAVTVP